MQTLEFARKVGAPRVVMHSGSIHFFFGSPEARLEKWVDASELKGEALWSDAEFTKRRDRAMKPIRRKAADPLERVRAGYEALFEAARSLGLTMGIENREGMVELPLDDGFDAFFESLGPEAPVGYWHDCGHAQIKHQLGLLDHEAHLAKMAPRLVGFHLHDVSAEGKDHRQSGTGTVDFKMIARHVRPEHTLVLELSPSLSADQVRASREFILETLG
jgi:sugar phosphate isomerase/epimerase